MYFYRQSLHYFLPISVTNPVSQFGIVPYVPTLSQLMHSPYFGSSSKHSETNACQLASGMQSVHAHELSGPVTALVHANFA
ncbi:unnamed protein product [Bathycoccus prasinos]